MSVKITGYKIFISTGGNTCIQCKMRMRKGLPYISPITGKKKQRKLIGKSLCMTCVEELQKSIGEMAQSLQTDVEKYERRRFLTHLDKEISNELV